MSSCLINVGGMKLFFLGLTLLHRIPVLHFQSTTDILGMKLLHTGRFENYARH